MKRCQNCGQEVKDNASFCVMCGRPITGQKEDQSSYQRVTGRRCPRCGRVNRLQANFCVDCGENLAPRSNTEGSQISKQNWFLPVAIAIGVMLMLVVGMLIFVPISSNLIFTDPTENTGAKDLELENQKSTSSAASEWEQEEVLKENDQEEKYISIQPSSVVMEVGEQSPLTVQEGEVAWTVEDPDLVRLSTAWGETVQVEGLQPGYTTVIASSGELTARCEVVILQGEQSETAEDEIVYDSWDDLEQQEDAYILPTDSRLIEESELYGMSQEEVALARNEIYARHGYVFTTESYADYFEQQIWYTPDPNFDALDPTQLTEIERKNIDVIVGYEEKMGWR